ncbi:MULTISPECIES: PAS domain S-box protein [Methanobacterium]|uniref:histidine kinase n=1 Tax=Methanobacterium bryantii TaxID=2161 RepID=A0A2A2H9I2_METBR|nr:MULTISPECIES: PAS domain S-box protein [Methanobacterium]OEC86926.1 hypothetical protein A9507_08405 [Methanobacterium sp. A39]PAV05986.1 hypothetical protein ASJ80_14145 [Methanobacterium bryantii]
MKNTNTHLELEKKVQFLESILDSANEGYWEWDLTTNKVIFNRAWYNLFNYDLCELPQSFEAFEILLHPDDKEKTLESLNYNINNGSDGYKIDFRMIKKSGEICWILSRGNIERDGEGNPFRVIGTHFDITDYKLREEQVKYLNSILLAIRDINQLIVTEKDKNNLLNRACKILSETRGFDLVWIGEIEENSYNVISKAFSGSYIAFSDLMNVTWDDSLTGQGPTGKSIKTGKPCIVNNIGDNFNFTPWLDAVNRYGFNSAVAMPLTNNEKIWGNLTIYSSHINIFDDEEISLLKEVAADISFAIRAFELENQRKKAEEQKRKLIEELQQFTEELEVSNEKLQATMEELQLSNEELRQQGNKLIELNHALRSSEERSQALINNSNDIIHILDENGNIKFDSPSSTRILGYPEKYFIGKNPFDYIHPEDREMVMKNLQEVYEKRNLGISNEFRIKKADGSYLPVESVFQNLMNVPGIKGIVVTTHSIKDRKNAEEVLRISNIYNRSLIEANLDPLVTIGPDGKITDVNSSTESVTGYSRKELIGTEVSNYFTKPGQAKEGYQKVFKEGWVRDYPLEIVHKNGDITPVLYNASVYKDENGKIVGVFAAARDITELKKAEEEIQRLANLVESSNDAIITKDLDGVIISYNKGAERLYGYTAQEVKGKNIAMLTPPHLKKEVKHFIEQIKNGKRVFHYETKRVSKDGMEIDISLTLSPIIDQFGKLSGISTIARDISESKKAEEKIELASKYNRSLIEASLDPLVTIGPDGKITDVNSSTESVTGYSRKELIGTDFSDYFTEPEKAREGYQEAFREGRVRDYPLGIKNKDGYSTPVLYNASVYKDEFKNVTGVFAAARDITELKKAENEIKASLKEKELLLKEIHHRVKNNLQIISSLLDLQANYVDDTETINVLHESQNRVKSMAMIHEMLYQSPDLTSINFSNYIKSLIQDLVYSYGTKSNIRLIIDLEEVFLNIETAIPCGLVISELVSNSLKYAFPQDNVMGEIFIGLSSLSQGYELIVSDNGIGLPENIDLNNIESSLGLRLVDMLVKQIEGSIKLEKEQGSMFKVTFKELIYKKRF